MTTKADEMLVVNCIRSRELAGNVISKLYAKLSSDITPATATEEHASDSTPRRVTIDNKYFSADVDVTVFTKSADDARKIYGDRKLDVMLVLFSSSDCLVDFDETITQDIGTTKRFTELSSWLQLARDLSVDVRLLLDIDVTECSNEQLKDLLWDSALNRNFELVSSFSSADDEDDGFAEKVGVDRVMEALDCHMWPGHKRKHAATATNTSKSVVTTSSCESVTEEEHPAVNGHCNAADEKKPDLSSSASGEAEGGEPFEDLFSRFALMKETAQSLPSDERKLYAEKMALAFWKSMGGDDDDVVDE